MPLQVSIRCSQREFMTLTMVTVKVSVLNSSAIQTQNVYKQRRFYSPSSSRLSATPPGSPQTYLPQLLNVCRDLNRKYPPASQTNNIDTVDSITSDTMKYPLTCNEMYDARNNKEKKKASQSSTSSTNGATTPDCYYHDDRCFIIPDAFPKATYHCLVIPREGNRLRSLLDINKPSSVVVAGGGKQQNDLKLLEHMCRVGQAYIDFLSMNRDEKLSSSSAPNSPPASSLNFIMGFHSLPSLPLLHMHLISMDLESSFLKKKKHYNSFATNFFLPAARVVADVQLNGRVSLVGSHEAQEQSERLEKQTPMRCLWCNDALVQHTEGKSNSAATPCSLPHVMEHVRTCRFNRSRKE